MALALVVIATFFPALGHDFVWDDHINLTLSSQYRGLSWSHLRWMVTTFYMGHYQPLSWMTLGWDHHLWGMNPFGYHLTNLLLHAANAALFYYLVLMLLRLAPRSSTTSFTETAARYCAAAAALVFAIHPLRVESVVWISERRDVLSGFFYLATLVAYLRMQASPPASPPRRAWYAASVGFLVLSLLSKAWGMTLPFVLLALDLYPLRRQASTPKQRRALLREKVPYAVAAATAALLALLAQNQGAEMMTLEEHGPVVRLAQAVYGLCFYLVKTVAPFRLSPLYPLPAHFDPTAAVYAASGIAVITITILTIVGRKRWPWLLVSWFSYAVILAPVLGIAQTGPQIAADRYTYLSCLPWAVLAGAVLYRLRRGREQLVAAAAICGLAILCLLTVKQTQVWRDSATLWDHVLHLDPDNVIAYMNRGTAREAAGDLDGAFADYVAAIERNPNYGDPYFGRGNVRRARGDLDGALADYEMMIRLRPHDPMGYVNRGAVRHLKGELDAAAADYRRTLELASPDWVFRDVAVDNLAQITSGHGRGKLGAADAR